MVEGYASFLSCTAVVQASGSLTASMLSFNRWLKLDDCLWLGPPLFGVGVLCRILYFRVGYLYESCSGLTTSVGEERANVSDIVYL